MIVFHTRPLSTINGSHLCQLIVMDKKGSELNIDVVGDSLSCQKQSVHLLYDSQHKYAVLQKYHASPLD